MIHWIEARHKATGFMIKHSDFDTVNIIQAKDSEHLHMLFDYLVALRDMATGARRTSFLDYISRTFVKSDVGDLLWYCKSKHGPSLVLASHNQLHEETEAWIDEEEIYASDESLLFSRNLKGVQIMADQSFIPLNPSASTPSSLGLVEARALYEVFQKVLVFRIPEEGPDMLIESMSQVREDSILLINGIDHEEPQAIDAVLESIPATCQVLAFHARSNKYPTRQLEARHNGIALSKS